jgi:hypothetical protein
VRRIERVPPVHAAGKDAIDRRLLRLHHADLYRGGLRPETDLLVGPLHEERVLRGAGRMLVGRVERVEVQLRMLDLGPLLDLVAEADEDVDDLPQRLGQQVHVALALLRRRQGHIDALALPARVHLGGLERRPHLLDRVLELGLHGVR